MTLKCVWWFGSCPEILGDVEYFFVAITSKTTHARSGSSYLGILLVKLNYIIIKTI